MAFGIAAPLPYEVIGHGLLFVDIAIAMYDLDKFKRINDMYGHLAGDEALVAVSEAVRLQIMRGRDSGSLGRGRVYRHHETE